MDRLTVGILREVRAQIEIIAASAYGRQETTAKETAFRLLDLLVGEASVPCDTTEAGDPQEVTV
jgi:hypothetical protein